MAEGDDEVELHIVLSTSAEDVVPPDIMVRCFQKAKECDVNPTWTVVADCLQMEPTKKDVFVLESFDGPCFEHLIKFKCAVLGPRCLLTCLTDGIPIPSTAWPTFTCAMRDLVVTASGCGAEIKNKMKRLVGWMGGRYTSNLCSATTHLIVSHVKSAKYEMAVKSGTQVMTLDWVEAVWNASLKENVHGTDQQFEFYKCPVFLGLTVCSSKLAPRETKKVEQYVTKHGGKYIPSLSATVGLLVVRNTMGEKFKFAQQCNIPCVSINWIYDSISKGQALPTKPYEIHDTRASTPTREEEFVDFPDMSVISNINGDNRTHVDETLMSDTCTSTMSFQIPRAPQPTTPVKEANTLAKTPVKNNVETPGPSELKYLLDKMDLSKIKSAGSFLDGCGVYLYGWNTQQEEKLRRILKGSGAARFSELSDSVTHILVGDLNPALPRMLKNSGVRTHVVNIKWLCESIAQRHPASEELYSCLVSGPQSTAEPPSPLSKKGLALLSRDEVTHISPPPQPKDGGREHEAKASLLKAYQDVDINRTDVTSLYRNPPSGGLSDSVAMPPPPGRGCVPKIVMNETTTSSRTNFHHSTDQSNSSVDSQVEEVMVFLGLSFIIVGHADAYAEKLETELIRAYGGEVVPKSFKGIPNYAVVPLEGATLKHTTDEIVTVFWLEECIQQQQLVPLKYYHQPVVVNLEKKPLKGLVLAISGYTGQERVFLSELATMLGAVVQDVFAKKEKGGVKASSHLICAPSENGNKYNAAMKWGLPAVLHSWLLACASTASYVAEQPHLVNPNQVLSPVEAKTPSVGSDRVGTPVHPENPQVAALRTQSGNCTPDSPLHHDPVKIQELLNRPLLEKPYFIRTPNTPLGLSENPTKEESKRWHRWLNRLPDMRGSPPRAKRRDSTPLAEIKKRISRAQGVGTRESDDADNGENSELEQPAKRQRLADDNNDTPKTLAEASEEGLPGSSTAKPRQLFGDSKHSVDSPIEGQISKLNKLLQTPAAGRDRRASSIGPNAGSMNANAHTGSPGKVSMPHKAVLEVEASQPYEIRWEDPVNVGRVKKDKLSEKNSGTTEERQQKGNSSRSSEEPPLKLKCPEKKQDDAIPSNAEEKLAEDSSKTIKEEQQEQKSRRYSEESTAKLECPERKKYIFMLSNVEDRDGCISVVKKLNGIASESSSYDPDATHLVLDKPVRSEKLLAAISSGRWILHPSYLRQSLKTNMFVLEDDFEWGNPKNTHLTEMLELGSMEHSLAAAGYRWRVKLASKPGTGAFSGMRCVLYTSTEKAHSLTRLLRAGGGEVISAREKENATLCLVDVNLLRSSANQIRLQDFERFAELNIPCVPLIYLSDYLTKDPPPHPFQRVIPEYAALINKRNQKHV